MERLENLEDALKTELRDIYSAENQLLKALPKMIKKASSEQLKHGFSQHLKETEEQISRLDKIAEMMDFKISGKTCEGMKGLLAEGSEVMEKHGKNGGAPLVDALIIGAAQRVEHYEIAAYGTARTIAEVLGAEEVVRLLEETLAEEKKTDEKLTMVSEEEVLPACTAQETGEMEEEA